MRNISIEIDIEFSYHVCEKWLLGKQYSLLCWQSLCILYICLLNNSSSFWKKAFNTVLYLYCLYVNLCNCFRPSSWVHLNWFSTTSRPGYVSKKSLGTPLTSAIFNLFICYALACLFWSLAIRFFCLYKIPLYIYQYISTIWYWYHYCMNPIYKKTSWWTIHCFYYHYLNIWWNKY